MSFRQVLSSYCVLLILLSGGASVTPALGQRLQMDQLPMYGGITRSEVPELKEADEKFIADVTAKFGTREKASAAWVEQGFRFYQQDRLDMAMRRFNQAWLLNPENPEVYSGFASVLSDQGRYCEAQKHLDIGFSKGSFQDGFLPDAALIYSICAIEGRNVDASAKQASFKKADELLEKALASSTAPKSYTLTQWAKVLFVRGDYRGSWTKVSEHRNTIGRDVDARFLRELRAKMPEPQ
jgi:tetratricopeptide (TPR) repeat protein